MATILFGASNGSWLTDADWIGGVKPTAADDVIFTAASANCTIGNGAVCRSVDCTGYVGTWTGSASSTFSIGDGTAGTGSIALKLVAGMTFAPPTSFTTTFISTSATVQTIDSGGKTLGPVTFNATSNGSWQLTAALTTNAVVTLTKGTLDINGKTCSFTTFSSNNSNVRTLTLGSASISLTANANSAVWDTTTVTNLTITANTSTVTLTNRAGFTSATKDFNGLSVAFTGGVSSVSYGFPGSGNLTFANVTCTGTAAKDNIFGLGGNITCTGTFTVAGNSVTNRYQIGSNVIGTPRTITAVTVTCSNCDFQDITGAGAGSWNLAAITGNSGDCGGNSGITFTTPAAQTSTGTASFIWSTHGWTSRVPLPQDDVDVSNAFSSGQTITMDMPRMGKSIDFSGMSWTGTATIITLSPSATFYGSLTIKSGVTWTQVQPIIAAGRGSFTMTTAGTGGTGNFSLVAPGGTLTLQDSFTANQVFTISNGTFNANGFNVTCTSFSSTSQLTRTLTMGSGTWTVTAGAWTQTATGLTLNANDSTIALTQTSATDRTFAGGGFIYNNLTITGAGTGAWTFTGANTFNVFTIGAPKTVKFTAATTTTVTSFVAVGTAGNLVTISSATAATHTLADTSGTNSCDYLSLTNSIAGGGAAWYAGANSTNVSGNSGWIFTAPPGGVNSNFLMMMG